MVHDAARQQGSHLLDLYGQLALAGHLEDGYVVLVLGPVHHEHVGRGDDATDDAVLGLEAGGLVGGAEVGSVVLDKVEAWVVVWYLWRESGSNSEERSEEVLEGLDEGQR